MNETRKETLQKLKNEWFALTDAQRGHIVILGIGMILALTGVYLTFGASGLLIVIGTSIMFAVGGLYI